MEMLSKTAPSTALAKASDTPYTQLLTNVILAYRTAENEAYANDRELTDRLVELLHGRFGALTIWERLASLALA